MAKADSGQDQTVEDILASIRQAISADDQKRADTTGELKGDAPRLMHERRPGFSTPPAAREAAAKDAPPSSVPTPQAVDRSQMHDVIELAIEQALDSVGEQAPATAPSQPPRMIPQRPALRSAAAAARPQLEPLAREMPRPAPSPAPAPQRPSLLSPRTNAAVTMSFEDLAKAVAANTGRGLGEAVEEILRPMLRSWLDDNLPSLVERLVREEIERVSRGRR